MEIFRGLRHGDRVKCTAPGPFFGQTYTFLCVAENMVTGRRWLECYGGKPRHERTNCLPLDGVSKINFSKSNRRSNGRL